MSVQSMLKKISDDREPTSQVVGGSHVGQLRRYGVQYTITCPRSLVVKKEPLLGWLEKETYPRVTEAMAIFQSRPSTGRQITPIVAGVVVGSTYMKSLVLERILA